MEPQQSFSLTDHLEAWLRSDHAIEQLIPLTLNVVVAIAIFVVGSWLTGLFIRFVHQLMVVRGADKAADGFVSAVLNAVFKFILFILMLEQIGINTTSLLALLGAAGLAVGLALKDSLSNFASGVMLILFRPFRVGDYIEAAGIAATVDKISIFSTVLVTGDNKEIIVPNAQIYQGTITNYSARPLRRIDLSIAISYDDDLLSVKKLLENLILADKRTLDHPKHVIAVGDLNDKGVSLVVRVWVKTADYWAVRWDLLEQIKLEFDLKKVVIAGSKQEVRVYQGEIIQQQQEQEHHQ